MYHKLLRVQVDTIEQLQVVTEKLIQAHQQAEEMYINAPEPEIVVPEMKENDYETFHRAD